MSRYQDDIGGFFWSEDEDSEDMDMNMVPPYTIENKQLADLMLKLYPLDDDTAE